MINNCFYCLSISIPFIVIYFIIIKSDLSYKFLIVLNSMTEEVIPLRFDVEEVGKHVKSSKKRFTWELALKGRSHIVVLDFSFISGKVKVTVDRKILF